MKKYHLLLLIFIIFLTPNVFAQDFDVTTKITAPTCSGSSCSGGHYTGLEIQLTGQQTVYAVKTRYNGRLSTMRFNIPLSGLTNWPDGQCFSTGDVSYRLILEMDTSDWNNKFATPFISNGSNGTNWATSSVVFVSYKKIYFDFKIPNSANCEDFLYVYLQSTSVSSTTITQINNWQLQKVTLSVNWPGGSGGSGSGGTSTDSSNTDIINNQNQNTTDIIDNNNQNTNTLNESINSVCKDTTINIDSDLSMKSSYYLSNTGNEVQYNSAYISKYIKIKPGATYTISRITGGSQPSDVGYCRYNANKARYTCGSMPGENSSITFTADNYDAYLRVSFVSYRLVQVKGPICNNWEQEAQNETNQGIKDVNDSINNDNVDSGTGTDFFDDFEDEDFGLSSIITIPLNTIQNLTSQSCVALTIPIPFTNSSVSLPCMTEVYQQNIPTIYNLYKIVSFGIIAYFIAIDIFHMVKGFKDPESDKVEVLDL